MPLNLVRKPFYIQQSLHGILSKRYEKIIHCHCILFFRNIGLASQELYPAIKILLTCLSFSVSFMPQLIVCL